MKRSKPRSAANSTFLEQLREHTFFLDRNFGRHKVAGELRNIGLTVEVHYDHFPEAEAGEKGDADWIRDVSSRGWVILTRDENIRRNPLELAALRRSKARAFNFKNAQATAAEIAEAFRMAAGKIAKVIRNTRPPYIVGISLRGEITYIEAPGKRKGRK